MFQIELMGAEFSAAVTAMVIVMLVDVPARELDVADRELVITAQGNDFRDGDLERRCPHITRGVIGDHLRKFAPILKIVGAVFLVNDSGMIQIDERKRALPRSDMNGVEVAV